MSSLLFIFAILIYGIVLVILFAFGMNFLYLAFLALRQGQREPVAPPLREMPLVSVQLPIFNELYVAERLIDAVARFDWAPERLEILVLDDSTDETRAIVQQAVERWRAHGVNIQHIHRADRTGFKAGALALGMTETQAEYIAYFDADFVPPRDFLRQTMPHMADDKVAFIQTRWGHVNRNYSLLTFLQSLAIDAHFMVEQFARARAGYWFNFNGTAGVWRRAAIEHAGGWKQDTLTEDLDLSYRAFLNGWKALYLRDVVTPAELPVTFGAYQRQQHRWAKGSLECALELLPQVWRAPISLSHKLEGTFHLTGYSIHLFMFALMLVYPAVIFYAPQFPELLALYGVGALFNLSALAPTMYFTLAQKELGKDWWQKIPAILFIMALGAGMMPNTVRAAWQILIGRNKDFERTPKFGVARRDDAWVTKRYQLRIDLWILFELAMAGWNLGTLIYAWEMRNWIIAFYAGIFFVGAVFVTGLSLAQTFAVWQYRKKQVETRRVTDVA
ncbi:MAG: glycosyltransferase [Chloroflexi bacterium]|nr:glycosyltransferase [Chloroflexota bacterium]